MSYVVAFEEGQAQVVGYMFCDGRLATCRGAGEEDNIPGLLFRWLLTHCVILSTPNYYSISSCSK